MATAEQLKALIQSYTKGDDSRFLSVVDSFYRVLPFGTGGRRGPVGMGTNRFNEISLASSVEGHVDFWSRMD